MRFLIRKLIRRIRKKPRATIQDQLESKVKLWASYDEEIRRRVEGMTSPTLRVFTCGLCGKKFRQGDDFSDMLSMANHSPCNDGKEQITEESIGEVRAVKVPKDLPEREFIPYWRKRRMAEIVRPWLLPVYFSWLLLRWVMIYGRAHIGRG